MSAWEWAQTALLAANLGWTTLCLGGFLPGTMVVTSVLTAMLLIVHAAGALFEPRIPHPAGWWFIPFLAYAAANVIWISPVRWLGWFDWFNWAQLIAVFWVVLNGIRSRRTQAVLFGALLIIAVTSVWLACYQHFVEPHWLMLGRTQAEQYDGRSSGPFGIPNSLAALLLLLIPAVGALTVRRVSTALARVLFGWLLLVFLFGVGLTVSRGAWLALAVALTTWPVLAGRVGWAKRFALAAGVALAIVAAGFTVYRTSSLVRERFDELARDMGERSRPILWHAAWQIVRERPLVGGGAGSFNVRFEKYRPQGFLPQPIWAHNDYLNTLSDYGSIGFILFFGAVAVVVGGALRRRPRDADSTPPLTAAIGRTRHWLDEPLVRQGIGIGLLAFALQLFVDFHFKIPALAMGCACLAGLLISRVSPVSASPHRLLRWFRFLIPFALGVVILIGITPLYRGEALRFAARDAMDHMAKVPVADSVVRERLVQIRRELDEAVAVSSSNGQAWADRSYALAQWLRIEPADLKVLGKEAETDADRAIKLSPIVSEFWIRRGVARDIQDRWSDAGPDFAQAILLSPNGVLPWYHYAYHMSLRPTGLDMAEAAVQFCLILDPTNPEVQRLRHRLATSRSGS